MLEHHHPRIALACSFQKEEAVLIHMLLSLEPAARVFTIDTGALFPETYQTWRELEQRYGVRVEVFDALRDDGVPWTAATAAPSARSPRSTSRSTASTPGSRRAPRAVADARRRAEARLRRAARDLEGHPLADWDSDDVWKYIARHDVPYNALHDRGYESIGCAPCTLPGSGREGRWAGSEKTECGIHSEAMMNAICTAAPPV